MSSYEFQTLDTAVKYRGAVGDWHVHVLQAASKHQITVDGGLGREAYLDDIRMKSEGHWRGGLKSKTA